MRYVSRVNDIVGDICGLMYLVVFAVTIYDVGRRYFFSDPTIWGLELVIALAGIHYLLAGAQAVKNDAHVRIDALYRLMPLRARPYLDALAKVLAIVFLSVVAWFGTQQASTAVAIGETSGAGWNSHAPMWMKIAIPVGAAMMVAQLLVGLAGAVARIRGGAQDER